MFRKFIITLIFILSISALCAVPCFASTMTEQQMAIEQISLCWQTSTSKKNVISYDSLTSLCSDLNRDGYPCEIRFVSALNGYAIVGTGYVHNIYESSRVYSLGGKYYSNIEGSIYFTPYQSDSLLSGISTYVSTISSQLSTVIDRFSSLISNVSSIHSDLLNIDQISSACAQSLSNLNNYFTGEFRLYFSDIMNDVSSSNSFLGQINSKLDTIASNVYTSVGGSSSVLPDEYRRLSYIDTDGYQYINSSIYFDSSKSFQIDADVDFFNSDSQQVLFGFIDSSPDALYSLYINPSLPKKSYCYRYGRTVVESSGAFPTGSRHRVVSYCAPGQQYLSIDGVTVLSSSASSSFKGSIPCFLFAANSYDGGAFCHSYGRCYGLVIRQNGAVIRNYIPALRYSDSMPGLYDLVSGEFFPSAGNRFIAGPVMSSWTYDLISRISSRLDSIDSKLGSLTFPSSRFSPVWCPNGSFSSGDVSDVGYHSLSSLLSLVFSSGDDFKVYDGRRLMTLDSLNSIDLVEDTFSGHSGYFLRAFGRYYYSENAVNHFSTGYLYLGLRGSGGGSELFFADSRDGTDITGVTTRLDSILSKLDSSSGSNLTTLESTVANIESTLSIINDKLDNTATSIENTTVNITNNNPAYNVFYVTDENGEEHSITSVAADSLSASGKLLQFLYKLIVDGALSGVDSAVDGLNDFFFDSSPGSIVEGGSVWD